MRINLLNIENVGKCWFNQLDMQFFSNTLQASIIYYWSIKNIISTNNNKNDICQKHNWQFSSLKKVLTLECLILPHFHFLLMRKQQHLNTPQQDGCWIVLDVLIALCIYLWFHCFYSAVVITNINSPLLIHTCENLSDIFNVQFHFQPRSRPNMYN